MAETYWNPSQACRWIMWRRVDLAEAENGRKAQLAILHRGDKLGPPHVSTEDARFLLIEALQTSVISAVGPDGATIPPETWKPLKLDPFLEGVRIVADHETHKAPKPGPRPIIPRNPGIPSAAVMMIWPETAGGIGATAPTYWNLAETFHWIMWRNLKAVAAPNVGHASAIMRREEVGLVMPPAMARESLLESLRAGDLAAPSITREAWAALRFKWLEDGSGIVIVGDGGAAAPIPVNPKFPAEIVRTLWRDPAGAWLARARARDDYTRHQFIIEHAETWHRNSVAKNGVEPTLSVKMLAAELVRKAAAGAFEISLAATGLGGRGPDGLLLANLDVRNLRLTGTFTDKGELTFGEDITRWLESNRPSTHPENRALGVAYELRLDRAFLDHWRDSDEGRAWALDRGLSVPELPAAVEAAEIPTPSEPAVTTEPEGAPVASSPDDSAGPATPAATVEPAGEPAQPAAPEGPPDDDGETDDTGRPRYTQGTLDAWVSETIAARLAEGKGKPEGRASRGLEQMARTHFRRKITRAWFDEAWKKHAPEAWKKPGRRRYS